MSTTRDTDKDMPDPTVGDGKTPTERQRFASASSPPPPLPRPRPHKRKPQSAPTIPKLSAGKLSAAGKPPPAGPGRRSGTGGDSDLAVTKRIERVEPTPAPLPPSPAAKDAEVWFEQVPTNPAAIPDLEALAEAGANSALGPTASTNPMRRIAAEGSGTALGAQPWHIYGSPERPWLLPVLIAATFLAVGMVLGALLFGGGGTASTSPGAIPDNCECEAPSAAEP